MFTAPVMVPRLVVVVPAPLTVVTPAMVPPAAFENPLPAIFAVVIVPLFVVVPALCCSVPVPVARWSPCRIDRRSHRHRHCSEVPVPLFVTSSIWPLFVAFAVAVIVVRPVTSPFTVLLKPSAVTLAVVISPLFVVVPP